MRILFDSIQIAVSSLLAKKVRSFLSMLGIIIGILTISSLLSLAFGVRSEVEKTITNLGTNLVAVTPGKQLSEEGGANLAAQFGQSTLTEEDFLTVKEQVKDAKRVSVALLLTGTTRVGDITSNSASILAGSPGFEEIFNLSLDRGRLINQNDEDQKSRIVVLGPKTVDKLFGNIDPIGKSVEIRSTSFQVVGIFNKVETASNIGGPDFNDVVMMPIHTGWDITGTKSVFRIAMEAPDPESVERLKKEVREVLLKTHKGEEDFSVLTQKDLLKVTGGILDIMTALLGSLAAISLLVGGIGIMNIMLVSVSERTREIGIRKAVGATQGTILLQFLIESMILTLLGGLIAIGIFTFGLSLIPKDSPIPIKLNWSVLALSLVFSGLVGVIFGLIPAIRAARKNPIDALRYE
jgi:putative ABC transport system permease protein